MRNEALEAFCNMVWAAMPAASDRPDSLYPDESERVSRWCDLGGDLVSLARLLGHKDVNTTAAAYAIFSQDELAELHEKYSPLKGMMK